MTEATPDPLPHDPAWARIKKEGKLRWGADPSGGAPYIFVNPRNPDDVIGFELEIMEKVAERLGVQLELVKGDWDALPDSLRRPDPRQRHRGRPRRPAQL